MNNIQRIICCCVSAMLSVAYIVPQTTCVFAQEVSSQDEAQPFTTTLDDDFIANKLALMFKYDFTKQDIETTIAPKLIETIGSGKLKEFEYLDTVNIDDENSRQMYIALLDLEDSDKQSAFEIAVDLYETGYFYSVEMNMVGIPADVVELDTKDEAQPFTATLDDDFIANKLALMFKYDFTKQDIETTIAPKLIETIGGGKLKEFEYLDTVNIDDENSRQMYIALLDLEDSDKQSAYEIAVDLYETGYFYSVEVNMVGIPSITETTTTTTTTFEETTTTTTTEAEKITDIEQIREMFTKFIADNELDAKCVSDEAYPQYAGTVVIEFNSETAANTAILEYAEKSNIERTAFNLVPCVDGKPITTANPDAENTTTTTTTTTTTDETNTNLPQTGINSMTKILITITALTLTAAGAGAMYSSGILRRKEDDK